MGINLSALRATKFGQYATDRCRVDGDCLLWAQSKNADGYACMRTRLYGVDLMHRAMFKAFRGAIKHRLANRLACGNRHCVNPWHWDDIPNGKIISNQYKRGQRGPAIALRALAQAAHTNRAVCKGSLEKADQARSMHAAGASMQEVAKHFGIAKATAQRWVSGKAWAPVASPFAI